MMEILQAIITFVYYVLLGFIAGTLIYNLIKAKHWEKEILYVVVLIPFLLRLFRLK